MDSLFKPLHAGALQLPNRILMAPLTRCRAEDEHVPGALIAEHYAQRASAGLIVAEATMAMEGCSAFWKEPGIYSDAQVAGWKQTTDAVHAAMAVVLFSRSGMAVGPVIRLSTAAGNRLHRVLWRLPTTGCTPRKASKPTSCRAPCSIANCRGSSQVSPVPRPMPNWPVLTAVEVHGANGYCSTSSCAMAAISVRGLTAVRSKTVRACCLKRWTRFVRFGAAIASACVFHRSTATTA